VRSIRRDRLGLAVLAAAAVAACGRPAVSVGPPATGWPGMNGAERQAYMRSTVLPRIRELFVSFDPARYESMGCETCHGDGAAEGSFRMPSARLLRLPDSPDGFKRLAAEKPAMCQFMLTRVKPAMAALLGMPERGPDNRDGFGCQHCHKT
jgi:hypothetical protein